MGATVILFGAGASYGSVGVSPHPPPLGDVLFDQLALVSGSLASKLPADLAAAFRKKGGFETAMGELAKRNANDDVMRFQRELAAYIVGFSATRPTLKIDVSSAADRPSNLVPINLSITKADIQPDWSREFNLGAEEVLLLENWAEPVQAGGGWIGRKLCPPSRKATISPNYSAFWKAATT